MVPVPYTYGTACAVSYGGTVLQMISVVFKKQRNACQNLRGCELCFLKVPSTILRITDM
jgi:hypothetical protein